LKQGAHSRGEEQDKVVESLIAGVGVIDEVRTYRGQKILDIAARLRGSALPRIIGPELAIDVFYSFYMPIPEVDKAVEQKVTGSMEEIIRLSIIKALLKSNALWRVKPYTVADNMSSVVAAASFIERIARNLASQRMVLAGKGGRQQEDQGAGASQSDSQSDYEGDDAPESISYTVERVLEKLEQEVRTAKEIKQMIAGLGVGRSSVLDFDDSAEEIIRLARETDVDRILRSLRGMKIGISRSKLERQHPKGWIKGLEYGHDIERVHYSQLALPEDLFFANYSNGKLLLYEKVLEATKGPIYVLLDKSGSMIGAKIDWARAVAVALFKKAVDEGRRFYVRFFDSVAYPPLGLKPNAKTRDIVKLLGHLARVKAGGGTDIENAVRAASDDIRRSPRGEERISDIILITDGEDRINVESVRRVLEEVDARLHSVVIHGHNPHLQRISFRYMTVKRLSRGEALKVVEFI